MTRIQNYIGGELVAPVSGNHLDNIDPSRGQKYGEIPDSDQQDVQNAIDAAKNAFPIWSNTSNEDRSKVMLKIADLQGDFHNLNL